MDKTEHEDRRAEERDGCPSEVAVLQRFWRNTKRNIERQKEEAKPRDGDWWRGYEAALHWISHEAFNANAVEFPKKPHGESADLAALHNRLQEIGDLAASSRTGPGLREVLAEIERMSTETPNA